MASNRKVFNDRPLNGFKLFERELARVKLSIFKLFPYELFNKLCNRRFTHTPEKTVHTLLKQIE
ncbi:MAG: hypothetical protein H7A42_09110 [Chlamydiales bacterium]|nr:hypothetical protein [Chlamydiales bacterium]